MVFLTSVCLKYMPYWLRRSESRSVYFKRVALFRMTGHISGRSRNCWRAAIGKWTKTMEYQSKYRQIRKQMLQDLHSQRILAAVEEHGFKWEYFLSTLTKCGIELSRTSLSHLATYEPRTFKSLVDLTKFRFKEEGDSEIARNTKAPEGVVTRGMFD